MKIKRMKRKWLYIGFVCILFAVSMVGAVAYEFNGQDITVMPQQGGNDKLRLTEGELAEITRTLSPNEAPERTIIAIKAHSLRGDVAYFWGGKSSVIGWDDRWGTPSYVTSEGSGTTGSLRTFGLDCSGYVNWVFNNAARQDVSAKVGEGSTSQWMNSSAIRWEDARVGDLAFLYDPTVTSNTNHVGIVVGKNESNQFLVAHCSGSDNTVVVTEAQATGFQYMRTPHIYSDAGFLTSVLQEAATNEYYLALGQSQEEYVEYVDEPLEIEYDEEGNEIYRIKSSFK